MEVITPEGRLYALKELARRSGVTREFFRTWKIEIGGGEILVDVLHPAPSGSDSSLPRRPHRRRATQYYALHAPHGCDLLARPRVR